MIVNQLFPTPVAKFSLDREFTQEELGFVLSTERMPNMHNQRSVDSYFFEREAMKDLHRFCLEKTNECFQNIYAPKTEATMRITQSWGNYASANAGHHKHSHPNSFISGVLYLKADINKDRIYFHKETYEQISFQTENFNIFNSKSWWLPVGAGELLLFPSSVTHSVEPVVGEERVSIAFNTFPTGVIGSELALTELKL